MSSRHTLENLNDATTAQFVAALGDVFENAPWVAEATAAARPFATVTALHDAMIRAVRSASPEMRLALINGHPELAGKVARAGAMTDASKAEQGSLGLDKLSDSEFARFGELNAAYRAKFAIPFIVCVRRHTRDSILATFAKRLANTRDHEIETALEEIGYITRLRVVGKVDGPGLPKTDGHLSTHVLDTTNGRPAAGVHIELHEIGASARALLVSTTTNADGRTDGPLLSRAPLRIGTYELTFDVGTYFSAHDAPVSDPPYLGVVPVRFTITEPEGHYHVPLLVSPWGYTTYRGS